MSVTVELADLPSAIAARRLAYLVTTDETGAKIVAVDVVADDGGLVVTGTGPGSRAQLEQRSGVTLIFPPVDVHDLTLLVDGDGRMPAGDEVIVAPRSAVLHRPAPSLRR